MDSLPLVSICIPTYNATEFFEPCLQSALAQTYSHLEILISDDGSTDTTLEIVKTYQEKYPQIRLVLNPVKGMVNNWNNCIAQAHGQWIKFLFQDDVLKPACVQHMLEACLVRGASVGLCRRDFIIHDDVPRRIRHDFKYRMVLPERLFGETAFISPKRLADELSEVLPENGLGEPTCYFFQKDVFNETGLFNPDFKQVVDLELILRLGLLKGLVFVNEPLASFRVHGASESSANLKEDDEAKMRNIAAVVGDTLLLFHTFLHNPAFALVKEAMKEDVLQLRINHTYHSGCKHKGQRLFNKALAPIRAKYKELGEMKYSFFKYTQYRKQYRQWEKENRW